MYVPGRLHGSARCEDSILIVKFFEYVVDIRFTRPLELLYLADGIALIGLALYLSHAGEHAKQPNAHARTLFELKGVIPRASNPAPGVPVDAGAQSGSSSK